MGPDLSEAGKRLSREEILEAMIDPNAEVTPGYGTVTLTLESGQIIRGALIEETDTDITIRNQNEEQAIEKGQIVKRKNSP